MRSALRLALAGCLGLATALLMSCGSGGAANLIPAGNAGPLKDDLAAVASAVASGDCTATATAVQKAQSDLAALPGTVDAALRAKLTQGVSHVAALAPTECKNATTASTPTTATTVTTTPTTTTVPTTTATTTPTTPTTSTTTPTTPTDTTPTTTNNGGGTPAPGGAGGAAAPGGGSGGAQGNGQ